MKIIVAIFALLIVIAGGVATALARDARVISITPREQATLLEIEFDDNKVRTTLHVMSTSMKVTPGEKIEVSQGSDPYSYVVQTFFYQKAKFQAMIPRPAEVK